MVDFYSRNKWVGVITSVLLIANIITLVMLWTGARHPDGGVPVPPPPPGGGPAFEFVVKELGMNEQQQNAYRSLREEHQKQVRPLADSLRMAKDSFFSLLKDTLVSNTQLNEYSNRSALLQQQIELINFRHFQKIRSLCNNSQQQKFDKIIQEVLHRFASQRPPLRNGPPPGDEHHREELPPQ